LHLSRRKTIRIPEMARIKIETYNPTIRGRRKAGNDLIASNKSTPAEKAKRVAAFEAKMKAKKAATKAATTFAPFAPKTSGPEDAPKRKPKPRVQQSLPKDNPKKPNKRAKNPSVMSARRGGGPYG
jgi:hypothetical protein